jgi:hypothetical protein
VEKTKKKITLLLGVLIFLLFAGGFIYAQVQQDLTVTAQVVPATLELSGFTFPNSLVTISNFGTPMGTTTSAADGSFSRTFSPLTPGTYEITIVATDQFGTDTPLRQFSSADHHAATAFHELAHSTGHESRLNRPGVTGPIVFGSSDYSREELVAELTSAFICAELGLDNSLIQDSASYVSGWLNLLNEDKRAIMVASSQARHACDYIKGSQAST